MRRDNDDSGDARFSSSSVCDNSYMRGVVNSKKEDGERDKSFERGAKMTTTDTTITVTYDDGNEDFVINVGELDTELEFWLIDDELTDISGWDVEDLQELRDNTPSYECARVLDAAIQRAAVRDNQ